MPLFTVDKTELQRVNLPLPSHRTILDSIFDTNKNGCFVSHSQKHGCTVVECENQPRDMPVYAWKWIKL